MLTNFQRKKIHHKTQQYMYNKGAVNNPWRCKHIAVQPLEKFHTFLAHRSRFPSFGTNMNTVNQYVQKREIIDDLNYAAV